MVMVGAFFVGHEAVAKVLIGTAGDDTLVENDRDERLTGRDGEDRLKAVKLGGFGRDEEGES
jgi:hypothetical protein